MHWPGRKPTSCANQAQPPDAGEQVAFMFMKPSAQYPRVAVVLCGFAGPVTGGGNSDDWRQLFGARTSPSAIPCRPPMVRTPPCGMPESGPAGSRSLTPSTRGDMNSCLHDLAAHVGPCPRGRSPHGGGHREISTSGNSRRHQRIANGQQDVVVGRFCWPDRSCCNTPPKPPMMLMSNQNARHASPRTNFGCAIREPKKLASATSGAAALGSSSIRPAVQSAPLSVCRAWRPVKRATLRQCAPATPGDHHEVDHHENRKHDQAGPRSCRRSGVVAEGPRSPPAPVPGPRWLQQHHIAWRPRSATGASAWSAAAIKRPGSMVTRPSSP